MGRHTIGDRRGSVRGAPPDVYVPFGSFTDDPDSLGEAVGFFKTLLVGACIWVVVYFALAFLNLLGWSPWDIWER